jgi:hypothetical protein
MTSDGTARFVDPVRMFSREDALARPSPVPARRSHHPARVARGRNVNIHNYFCSPRIGRSLTCAVPSVQRLWFPPSRPAGARCSLRLSRRGHDWPKATPQGRGLDAGGGRSTLGEPAWAGGGDQFIGCLTLPVGTAGELQPRLPLTARAWPFAERPQATHPILPSPIDVRQADSLSRFVSRATLPN